MGIRFAFALAAITALASPAGAAVLDFNEPTAGYQGTGSISLSNADIVTTGVDSYAISSAEAAIFGFGSFGGFCGVTTTGGGDCSVDTTITFADLVADLSFTAAVFDAGDSVIATIFSGATALATQSITAAGVIDFSGYSGITSLFLDDQGSTGGGIVFGDFTFTADVAAVPLPAGAPLLLLGLAALGLRRRTR